MKNNFNVEITNYKNIHSLPDYWDSNKYKELLEIMEYGDTAELSDQELKEMCLLSLADNEPEEAAKIILNYIFEEDLNEGQINNLSHEMLSEKLWEEYADINLHEKLFNAHQILFDAYNGKFPNTEAVSFNITIANEDKDELEIFTEENNSAPIVRLLANGMPENTLINRLYKDEIKSENFSEAKDIIWQLNFKGQSSDSINFELISSNYWFKDLKFIDQFEASSHADKIEIPEEDS
ncbi:hypothetical protein SAMN03097699_1005 [Flavobacteriaceae bacterium MAR_2010_188]|nr:hypothetical protein SAMN03097699_1005 [Flavobacteriaceae bacterium MAR_2010_188]